ncbi:MAG: beta-L-arabinofuranosidase domain-containing protein [Terracidiphilus sp.]
MNRKSITRRGFLRTTAAAAAGSAFVPLNRFAKAQDPVLDVSRSNNHTGYEKVSWKAVPFPMNQVRLHDGPFKDMQERDRVYLYMLPNDRLLHSFRLTAGKSSTAQPLGGWEAPDGELRGHFAGGHYLSACALMFASTGDEALRVKAEALVMSLAECQQENGYLSAYPESFYDRLKNHVPVWAPFYTYHKILAGHLDMYTYCGSDIALRTARRMADWAVAWIAPLSDEELAKVQMTEHGGMNEALFNLYAITGEKKYLDGGLRFEHKRFFDPLAAQQDKLAGLHTNTNIPKVIGAARGYELTGDERYRTIAEFFWQTVVDHHTYAPGGTSNSDEGWSEPDTLGSHLAAAGQECCCSYNMLKLTRHLFGLKPEAHRMDYYERLLWNVRAGTQSTESMFMYYVPTAAGAWKTFGNQTDCFWCCTGTGVEEYAKLVDTIYFHDDSSVYVNQFIASEVSWPEKRVRLVQQTSFPEEERTSIVVRAEKPSEFAIRIRAPHWSKGVSVAVNGHAQPQSVGSDGYLVIHRTWQPGDRVEVSLPMTLREEPLAGSPELVALAYGPLVLAAQMGRDGLSRDMIDGPSAPRLDRLPVLPMPKFEPGSSSHTASTAISWVKKDAESDLRFRSSGQPQDYSLKPLYQILDERYSVYWQRLSKA